MQMLLLQSVPEFGPAKAAALLNAFGSLEAVFAAQAEELREVSGIGSKSAARLRWILS